MINIKDLPIEKQQEILGKTNKYHNTKTARGNIKFDSKKEAERYDTLLMMEQAHLIRGLKLQPEFTLIEGYKTADGEKVRPTKYVADFSYFDQDGHLVIEDVKSPATKTKVYEMKKKMLREKYGYKIEEV